MPELGGHALGVWLTFSGLVAFLLWLDLGVLNRRAHALSIREATLASAGWVTLALLFGGFLWLREGATHALEYYTGYLIELSLSVDNLFVFILVFNTFAVPAIYQHRVLFWGILTAIVLRAAMILGGAALIQRFDWLIYVFGAFLVITGIKLALRDEEEEPHPEKSWSFRTLRRIVPATSTYHGHAFFVRVAGRLVATPLFLALAMIEISDVIFALDSIPAIFGVTLDPFIVFTSNIFAILGLRSLFFAVARMMDRFAYLEVGLSAVLIFIGAKMLASGWIHVSPLVSLAVVILLLGGSMGYSIWRSRREIPEAEAIVPAKKD